MSQILPHDEIEFDNNVELEDILDTTDYNDTGYFVEVDVKYSDNIKEKTKEFPFCAENRKVNSTDFTEYMKKNKSKTNIENKKLLCDWSDNKNYLIHFRMLKFNVRHGKIIEKVHNNISFNQSLWFKKCTDFITQKRNEAINDFEKDSYSFFKNSFFDKTMEKVRNRMKVDYIKKDDNEKIIKQQ